MDNTSSSSTRHVRKLINKTSKAVMKSYGVSLPNYDLPIRLRPWFLLFTAAIMLFLAFLGFTNVSHSLPLNDKFLHLTCFCVATGVFYFILDVEEDARRIWFWRYANLMFTAVICFFFGGFVSEVVQSMLPHKRFDTGDVVANIIGSTIGLYVSYHAEKHYRSRREISRLYRPLNTDDFLHPEDYSDEEAGPSGTQLLPLFNLQSTKSLPKTFKADRLSDVWDEREEPFGTGDDSDSEDTSTPPSTNRSPRPGAVPTITITRA